jgi:hypothetical protein
MKNDIANNRLPYHEDWEALINEYGQEGIIGELQHLWRTGQVATIIKLQPLFIDESNYNAENV